VPSTTVAQGGTLAGTGLARFSDQARRALAAGPVMQQDPGGTVNAPTAPTVNTVTAFIGGGRCVRLSIESAPTSATTASGAPYQVKECIITTKPGARLTALAVNMIARLRWCAVFSC
jgi:hypothetical protein